MLISYKTERNSSLTVKKKKNPTSYQSISNTVCKQALFSG